MSPSIFEPFKMSSSLNPNTPNINFKPPAIREYNFIENIENINKKQHYNTISKSIDITDEKTQNNQLNFKINYEESRNV